MLIDEELIALCSLNHRNTNPTSSKKPIVAATFSSNIYYNSKKYIMNNGGGGLTGREGEVFHPSQSSTYSNFIITVGVL